jgi:hypothetical protein
MYLGTRNRRGMAVLMELAGFASAGNSSGAEAHLLGK